MATAKHTLEIMTGKAHAAHDIDFKKLMLGLVRFIENPNSLIDAEVVDQNIDFGE